MKRIVLLLALLAAPAWAALTALNPREEAVPLWENRRVLIAPPAGFALKIGADDLGLPVARVADAKEQFSVELRFLPDPEGRFGAARARREQMVEMFSEYVGASTEKGMQFEELEPKSGAGSYCVFTDEKLVGRTTLPPGEFIHVTAGVKAWRGVLITFRFFSNDTTSPSYQSVMKMLRESVAEKPVPLR